MSESGVTEIPYGFCKCGCGQRTTIATRTNAKSGEVLGEPRRYIQGHNQRGKQHTHTWNRRVCIERKRAEMERRFACEGEPSNG